MEAPMRSGRAEAASGLPVRDIADIHLADLVGGGGCPICALRSTTAARYLASVLWEGVNDPPTRAELVRAGGYCREHSHRLIEINREQSGGVLGTAILYAAILRSRLERVRPLRERGRRTPTPELVVATRPPDCPVCRQVSGAVADASSRLVHLTVEPAWAEALAKAELCLDDLLLLWETAGAMREGDRAAWRPVGELQLDRVVALERELEAFAHHSSYDRRHLLTEAELEAAARASRLLGGDRDRTRASGRRFP